MNKNTKLQNPNSKEIPTNKLQKTAAVAALGFGAWSFFGVWC
jgi:hypothetical protein